MSWGFRPALPLTGGFWPRGRLCPPIVGEWYDIPGGRQDRRRVYLWRWLTWRPLLSTSNTTTQRHHSWTADGTRSMSVSNGLLRRFQTSSTLYQQQRSDHWRNLRRVPIPLLFGLGCRTSTFQNEKVKNLLLSAVCLYTGDLGRLNYNKTVFGRIPLGSSRCSSRSQVGWGGIRPPLSPPLSSRGTQGRPRLVLLLNWSKLRPWIRPVIWLLEVRQSQSLIALIIIIMIIIRCWSQWTCRLQIFWTIWAVKSVQYLVTTERDIPLSASVGHSAAL